MIEPDRPDEELEEGDEPELQEAENAVPSPKVSPIRLASANFFASQQVDDFLREEAAELITIVGEKDSGKTTLICEMYEQFRKSPFAGFLFGGCRTFHAIEKRAHPSREVSGRKCATTPHTSIQDGLRFMQLTVAPKNTPERPKNLFLSDRAGETYKNARADTGIAQGLIEVAKGRCIAVLVDGKRLADPQERVNALKNARQTLMAFSDAQVLGKQAAVQVIFTKIDLRTALQDPYKSTLATEVERFKAGLVRDLAVRFESLTFHEISARPAPNTIDKPQGLEVLFSSWMSLPERAAKATSAPPLSLSTEFDRLATRTPIETEP